MNKIERENISKFLSFVLRHQPEAINISLDREGWTDIDILIKQAAVYGKSLTLNLIRDVVNSNDKRRFELSDHGDLIRAVQGHSTKTVARVFEPKSPPALLYHGTASLSRYSQAFSGFDSKRRLIAYVPSSCSSIC